MATTSPRKLFPSDSDLDPTLQPGESIFDAFGRRVTAKRKVVGDLVTQDVQEMSPRTRAILGGFFGPRISPALAQAAGAQAGRPGASIEGILGNLATTSGAEIARELAGLQSEIERVRRGIPEPSSAGGQALEGAIEGATAGSAGGPIGAIVGGVTGAIGGSRRGAAQRDAIKRAQGEVEGAALEATPEGFGQELEEQEEEARLESLTLGEGARRQQAIEGIISATGLRDTSLGTLASIAAGIQVPLASREQTLQTSLAQTTREVEQRLGTAVRTERRPDRVAQALTALSVAFLSRGRGKGKTPGTTTEGGEENFGELRKAFETDLFPIDETEEVTNEAGIF